ncbi:MAG: class I SAM-dependent methyltransferase [Candidatus Microthrix sp.]|nr:class I SAM-dependent methyltransferase [Candidatus Microthrix sp.]
MTIAQEQRDYAEKRAAQRRLEPRQRLQLRDFADATGRCDAIVSIEMIESIEQDPAGLSCSTPSPLPEARWTEAPFQIITIDDGLGHLPSAQRLHPGVIFPGGCLPRPQGDLGGCPPQTAWPRSTCSTLASPTPARWSTGRSASRPPGPRSRQWASTIARRMWRYYLAYARLASSWGHLV